MFLIKKKNLLTQGNLQIIEYSLIGALTSLTPTERQKTGMQVIQGVSESEELFLDTGTG